MSIKVKPNGDNTSDVIIPKWLWSLLFVAVTAITHNAIRVSVNTSLLSSMDTTLREVKAEIAAIGLTLTNVSDEQQRRTHNVYAVEKIQADMVDLRERIARLEERIGQ